jgi:hypothetical protein
MKAIYVALPTEAFEALRRLAARELRHPRQQAARLILDGLRRDVSDASLGATSVEVARERRRDG